MKKLLIVGGVLLVGIVALITASLLRQGNDRRALAAYKAQLRAQGEWLTIEDAGYPFELDTNSDFKTFTNLATQLSQRAGFPPALEHMPYAGPGLMILAWKQPAPVMSAGIQQSSAGLTWEKLAADCDVVAPTLEALRAELEHPPRRFNWIYTNLLGSAWPRLPLVELRQAAQVLATDTLVALYEDDPGRARADLHALTQTTQVCREDLLLVTSMIRVALAELGLSVTAQALPYEGWDEEGLAALQRNWESVNLLDAAERCVAGERVFGLQMLAQLRQQSTTNTPSAMRAASSGSGTRPDLKDRLLERLGSMLWRTHIDQDELFYIRHYQETLEAWRELRANDNWAPLRERMQAQQDACDEMIGSPLGSLRYPFSAMAIANLSRAAETTIKHEVLRRMTLTAIALERFRLRHGSHPQNLQMLVPEFLAEVPLDLWSGKPLCYVLNPDGTIILYSVGEDGVDDGGECTPAAAPVRIDFWTGKDVVWPRVYSATNSVGE